MKIAMCTVSIVRYYNVEVEVADDATEEDIIEEAKHMAMCGDGTPLWGEEDDVQLVTIDEIEEVEDDEN